MVDTERLADSRQDIQKQLMFAYSTGSYESNDDRYLEGYKNGYSDGYDEKKDEIDEDINDSYKEGLEEGIRLGENLIIQKLGYCCILNIQEKTQYQVCYGDKVDLDELIEAIKKLSDL